MVGNTYIAWLTHIPAARIVRNLGQYSFCPLTCRPCLALLRTNGDIPRIYVKTHHADPQQLLVNGRALASTFAGKDCSDKE